MCAALQEKAAAGCSEAQLSASHPLVLMEGPGAVLCLFPMIMEVPSHGQSPS